MMPPTKSVSRGSTDEPAGPTLAFGIWLIYMVKAENILGWSINPWALANPMAQTMPPSAFICPDDLPGDSSSAMAKIRLLERQFGLDWVMKVKASPRSRKIVVEMEPRESGLPLIPGPEIALKKILVPVDFSPLAQKALHYGISFAKLFHAEVYLLHVVEPVQLPPPDMALPASGASYELELKQFAEQRLAEWQQEVATSATVKTSIRGGSPYREIVEAANENNIDLIIVGTHGRTGLPHLLMGSTAERIVRHAPCPVMVIRDREHDFLAPND